MRVSTRSLEPATGGDGQRRAVPRDHGEPVVALRWWERLRSAALLAVLAVVLGGFAAMAAGIAVLSLFNLLRGAVG